MADDTHQAPELAHGFHQHDGGQPHNHKHADGHHHQSELDHWHDEFGEHHGDSMSPEETEALGNTLWHLENVVLTTVGVDVGSSTSHLMFARVHLQRIGQGLSTRFVVVNREILWQSPILITPYRADDLIDAEQLAAFVHEAYRSAGLQRADVDTGAIILTGEALKRANSRAIADLFAEEAGKFVCASAGHHLEALLAAHGSGSVALSRRTGQTILNVDIGGGTCKFGLIQNGTVLSTAAVAVGGRLIVRDDSGALIRIDGPALQVAESLGVALDLGGTLSPESERQIVATWADVIASIARQEPVGPLAASLLLTEPLAAFPKPETVTFSGGVSEYIHSREQGDYGDLGRPLANALRAALSDGRVDLPVVDPGQGIRATVIGASQFTVQVSGNTIAISDEGDLPLRNLPVLYPRIDLAQDVSATEVAAAIHNALLRLDLEDGEDAVALAFHWHGDPLYRKLRALAEGIKNGVPRSIERGLPFVLLFDRDVGKTVGNILKQDLKVSNQIVSLDGVQIEEFDFVDIGEVIQPANVVPVVIKSLLFGSPTERSHVAEGH